MDTLRSGNYYTSHDLATKVHRTNMTIFRWLKAGKLKPTYIGDLLRFHEDDVKHLFVKKTDPLT